MMAQKADIAIVGGGIVGLSAAIHLQRMGRKPLLIDKDAIGAGASYGNAGVLASGSVVPVTVPNLIPKIPAMLVKKSSPLFVKWHYLPFMAGFLSRYLLHCHPDKVKHIAKGLAPLVQDSCDQHKNLADDGQSRQFIRDCHYVFAYKNRAAYEADKFGWELRRQNGFEWDIYEKQAIKTIEPDLSPDYQWVAAIKHNGHISDPGAYLAALADEYRKAGGKFYKGELCDIMPKESGVVLHFNDGAMVEADKAIIASGAWSGRLAKAQGIKVGLESERGYHIEILGSNITPNNPIIEAEGKFVASPMQGRIRFAGLVEFGGLNALPAKAPLRYLYEGAKRMFPQLSMPAFESKQIITWQGHRPATPDSLPVIGQSPQSPHVIFAYGHHHIGLTAGPKTGLIAAQLANHIQPNLDLSPYSPAR